MDLTITEKDFYSPPDFLEAHDKHRAMCGHGALAAVLGIPVVDACQFLKGTWVNIPMMKAAIKKAGFYTSPNPINLDMQLVMIQFLGSWMEPGVPPGARCQYRHWVAFFGHEDKKRKPNTLEGLVWDANAGRWMWSEEWGSSIMPRILPKRATGWEVFMRLAIKKNLNAAQNWKPETTSNMPQCSSGNMPEQIDPARPVKDKCEATSKNEGTPNPAQDEKALASRPGGRDVTVGTLLSV